MWIFPWRLLETYEYRVLQNIASQIFKVKFHGIHLIVKFNNTLINAIFVRTITLLFNK